MMTLLLAIMLIVGLDLSGWWIPAAVIVWVIHLWFHDDSAIAKNLSLIYQKQFRTNQLLQGIHRRLKDD